MNPIPHMNAVEWTVTLLLLLMTVVFVGALLIERETGFPARVALQQWLGR